MATDIASLGIEIKANDIKSAVKELDRLERGAVRTEKATSKLQKVTGALTSKMAAFVTIGSAATLAYKTKEAIEYADAIAKTADKLGVTTDALQEYRFAAERSGVAQTALDMGLQRFSRRLGEADKGTGELKDTLAQLNITTRDQEGNLKTSEEVLREYANAIQAAEGDQEKLRLAFKAFDSEGAAMVNMLRDGSQGLEELQKQARDAGIVIDESLIRKAEIANDKWDTLTQTIKSKFTSAAIGALGLVVDLRTNQEKLTDAQNDYNKVTATLQELSNRGLDQGDILFKQNQDKLFQLGDLISKLKEQKKAEEDLKGGGATDQGADINELMRISEEQQAVQKFFRDQENEQKLLDEQEFHQAFVAAKAINNAELLNQEQEKQQALKAITMAGLHNLTALMWSGSKKLFAIGKLASLSTAAVKGYEAVQSAYAAGNKVGGPIIGAAFAATAFGVQASNVQRIRKQKFVARKNGGDFAAGDRMMVGEDGPEVVDFGQSGTVINNNSLGGNKNVTLNVSMASDAMIEDWTKRNRSMLFNLMSEALNENTGSFA